MRYLLATNVCIDLLRGRNPYLDAHIRGFRPGDLGIASVTLFELFYGVGRSLHRTRDEAALIAFVSPLEVAPFDTAAARFAGHLRAFLERAGTPIGQSDLLIASQALALGIPLVTRNEREFRRVPGLRIANWHLPPPIVEES